MKKSFLVIMLLAAMNSNAQWVQMSNGMPTNKSIFSFASLGTNIFATSSAGIFLSTDYGISWSERNNGLTSLRVNDLAVIGTNIFAANDAGGVLLSTNNGSNWNPVNNGLTNLWASTFCVSGTNLFVSTGAGVSISTNYGTNWTAANNGLTGLPVFCFASSGSNVFAGTNTGGVFLTTNNGANWTAINNGLTSLGIFTLEVSGNSLFAGTSEAGIFRSTNNGANWFSVNNGLTNLKVNTIMASGSNLYAGIGSLFGTLYNGGIYISTNNGTNWVNKSQGLGDSAIVYSQIIANNYLFLGLHAKSVWRRSLSEIIGIHNISTEIPLKYSLSQNYPNPFNPETRIRYSLPHSSFVKLVVYDALGREIKTLVNESQQAGTYEASFNGSALSSGVYFYKLIEDDFSETKRMLMIK